MTDLNLGAGLKLPLDAVTETFAIVGRRGTGKTSTGVVLAEEMLEARQRIAVIDPTGVWWGLRSSASGKRAGYPVVIFGGEHGDLPLEPDAGHLVADLVVDHRLAVVLDLSHMRKNQQRTFNTAFLETLYHRSRDPIHVFIDEADLVAPQRPQKGAERLLGAAEDLVRRGRVRGIGVTLISQRPAAINKDVLTQAAVLVAMQLTGPQDRDAVDTWVKQNGDETQRRKLLESIASLPVGTAWVWSPSWLDVFKKVPIRRRRTFDSSATPKVGERTRTPARTATVDLDQVRTRMSELVERAEADDPTLLRQRIARLERDLARATSTPPPAPRVEHIEVPVLDDTTRTALLDELDTVRATVDEAVRRLGDIHQQLEQLPARDAPTYQVGRRPRERRPTSRSSNPKQVHPRTPTAAPLRPTSDDSTLDHLSKAERAILSVLATYGPSAKRQLALLAGYSARGGGYNNALSSLRTAGLIVGSDPLELTSHGLATIDGRFEPLPSGPALLDHWTSKLPKAERAALETLVDAWPDALTKQELADRTGYSATGGGFNNALSKLRTLELISGSTELTADHTLGEQVHG